MSAIRCTGLVAAAIAVAATVVTIQAGDLNQAKAQAPAAKAANADEQAVLQAEKDRFAAMQGADVAALEKLLAPELTYTHANAATQDKAMFIGDIKSGAIKYLMIEPSEMKVRVFGTVAIVTGIASVHVIQNGNDLTFKIRYLDNHLKRAGAWQMVAWQSTRFPA